MTLYRNLILALTGPAALRPCLWSDVILPTLLPACCYKALDSPPWCRPPLSICSEEALPYPFSNLQVITHEMLLKLNTLPQISNVQKLFMEHANANNNRTTPTVQMVVHICRPF